MANPVVLGIDPGKTGACAVLTLESEAIALLGFPPGGFGELAEQVRDVHANNLIRLAVLEKVGSMNTWAKPACFAFGVNFGGWQGLLAAFSIGCELATPSKWRSVLDSGMKKKPSKADLIAAAKRRWPMADIGRSHGKAEALFIAEYARRQLLGVG